LRADERARGADREIRELLFVRNVDYRDVVRQARILEADVGAIAEGRRADARDVVGLR
jgi:hypothetical protein